MSKFSIIFYLLIILFSTACSENKSNVSNNEINENSSSTNCKMQKSQLLMRWKSCDSSVSCYDRRIKSAGVKRETQVILNLPSLGPIAKEAHLLTIDDGSTWPSSLRNKIEEHYKFSEKTSGYKMKRREPWAPAGEGGSKFGQGATGVAIPSLDEAWYITMNWRKRPSKGTRMIVHDPVSQKTVVAAAGYETGPTSNKMIAGVTEEIHHYLGTTHAKSLMIGFAVDQNLSLGPIVNCPVSSFK